MTITTVQIGGDDYPSYNSIAEADKYLAGDVGKTAAWSALTDESKAVHLVTASRMIDDAGEYSGSKEVSSQPLEWPRTGATCNGEDVPDGTPERIFEAHIILAGAIAANPAIAGGGASGGGGTGTAQIRRVSEDSIEWFQLTDAQARAAEQATEVVMAVPDATADRLIRCFLSGARGTADAGAGGAFGDSSFTDEQSAFTDPRRYDKILRY